MLEAYLPFWGLLIFGNIENLILASQGIVKKANVIKLSIYSIIIVILWFILGTVATDLFINFAKEIDFIGGLAIFILGIQSMYESYKTSDDVEIEPIIDESQLFKQFSGLLIFGNIENLILACQGAVASVNPIVLLVLSLIAVAIWLLLGIYGTKIAIKYSRYIEFIGGLAIFLLGIKPMIGVL